MDVRRPRHSRQTSRDVANKLSSSQEGAELRRSIWAGFAKSRFWRLYRPPNIDTLILWVTIVALVVIGIDFFGRHSLGWFENYAIPFIVGPLSLWYVVRENISILTSKWESGWGKLAYGFTAFLTVTASKIAADQTIRVWTQSNPALFSSSQQALTALYIVSISIVLVVLYIEIIVLLRMLRFYGVMYLDLMLSMLDMFSFREMLAIPRARFPFRRLGNVLPYLFALLPLFSILSLLEHNPLRLLGITEPGNVSEWILIWTSFVPNGSAGSAAGPSAATQKFCRNLATDVFVSPFSTSEPMPDRVVVAERRRDGPDAVGRTYNYRIVSFDNLAGP